MDDLERRIRDARPLSGNRSLPLTDRAKRELAELVMTAPARETSVARATPRRRWLHRPGLVPVAAGVVALSAVAVWSAMPSPAMAATPPPLEIQPAAQTAQEMLADLSERACIAPADTADTADADDVTVIVTHEWNLAVEVDGDGSVVASAVSPEVVTMIRHDNGDVSLEASAGIAYDSDGPIADPETTPGSLLWSNSFRRDEFAAPYDESFPADTAEFPSFLSAGTDLDVEGSGSHAFLAMAQFLRVEALNCGERARLIEFVAELPDVELAGVTLDRLGRDAVAFTADRPEGEYEGYRDYLLLSPETGEILAVEEEYIGTARADISAPTVTSYIAWEKSEQ